MRGVRNKKQKLFDFFFCIRDASLARRGIAFARGKLFLHSLAGFSRIVNFLRLLLHPHSAYSGFFHPDLSLRAETKMTGVENF